MALVAVLSKVVILLLLVANIDHGGVWSLFCGVSLGDFSSFCNYLAERERERERERAGCFTLIIILM